MDEECETIRKRAPLGDITNNRNEKRQSSFAAADFLPTTEHNNNVECKDESLTYPSQNVHPILPRYTT